MSLVDIVTGVAATLPAKVLARLFAWSTAGHGVALCLHRVLPQRRASDPVPECTFLIPDLDRLVSLLWDARPEHGWLTMTFDDGYRDALEFTARLAPQYPGIDWLIFVCPDKIARRRGFRWDCYERVTDGGTQSIGDVGAFVNGNLDLDAEYARADLAGLADDPAFALATVDECRALLRVAPNILLGNHSNAHLKLALLDDPSAQRDLEASHQQFTELFGPPRHFAFPFGTPGTDYRPQHVAMLRRLGEFPIWTTEARPYPLQSYGGRGVPSQEVRVLPRFPPDGRKTPRQLLA